MVRYLKKIFLENICENLKLIFKICEKIKIKISFKIGNLIFKYVNWKYNKIYDKSI